MTDNNSSFEPIFGLTVAKEQYGVIADYSIYKEITSEDFSLSVTRSGVRHDVKVTVQTDVSPYPFDGLLTVIRPREETEAGTHTLEWTSNSTGILAVGGGKLQVIPFSEMGILVGDSGGCSWYGAPSYDAVFGRDSSEHWAWFAVAEYDDLCDEINQTT